MSSQPKKRPVIYRPYDYDRYRYSLDDELEALVESAGLLDDAEELMECLKASPRFEANVRTKAQRDIEQKRKEIDTTTARLKAELQEAEDRVRQLAGCGNDV